MKEADRTTGDIKTGLGAHAGATLDITTLLNIIVCAITGRPHCTSLFNTDAPFSLFVQILTGFTKKTDQTKIKIVPLYAYPDLRELCMSDK